MDKDKQKRADEPESILDFEDAKEMTIGQAVRKSEELEAGVTENDSILDKYIKQHREEIEAGKFTVAQKAEELEEKSETAQANTQAFAVPAETKTVSLEDMDQKISDDVDHLAETKVFQSDQVVEDQELAETKEVVLDTIPLVDEGTSAEDIYPELHETLEDIPFYKKKRVIYWSVGAVLVILLLGTGYVALNHGNQTGSTTASSSQSSSSSKTSSSSEHADVKSFNDLYASFFTDKNQLNLKNDRFGELDNLKKALDKLNGTSDYQAAKDKYDQLVKQVSAIQAVNSQFETPVITDGVLDNKAQVKADATFGDSKTGNSTLDSLLMSAISQGRSQRSTQSNAGGVANAGEAEVTTQAPATNPTNEVSTPTPSGEVVSDNVGVYGLSSAGVTLQRNLSRVPYNQAMIDDANNPAWTFNPGVLEKILATSRARGYITGDQYILEKVNIINGNGYYNLFKPDGTYLFSINCKTGYFVGNGSGYSDSLDY